MALKKDKKVLIQNLIEDQEIKIENKIVEVKSDF